MRRDCIRRPVLTSLALLVLLPAARLGAEGCAGDWDRPVVCSIDLYGAAPGDRMGRLAPSDPIRLEIGQSFELEFGAYDQWSRRFPAERLSFGLDVDSYCDRLLEIEERGEGRYSLRAGKSRGDCRAMLWIPGNMNLEWPLRFEVTGLESSGYSRAEAEAVTRRLYAGLLGREPDPDGLRAHTSELQRGNLAAIIDGMVGSQEFRARQAESNPAALLEQIYQGLLGRVPDSAGVRRFLGSAERGRYGEIVWECLHSEEFEALLLDETSGQD